MKQGQKDGYNNTQTATDFSGNRTVSIFDINNKLIKYAKPIAKSLSNGLIAVLKPGKDITGINYIISTVENFASEDDLVTKGYNQVLNVAPFVGTIKGIKELICNEAKVEIINYGERD